MVELLAPLAFGFDVVEGFFTAVGWLAAALAWTLLGFDDYWAAFDFTDGCFEIGVVGVGAAGDDPVAIGGAFAVAVAVAVEGGFQMAGRR